MAGFFKKLLKGVLIGGGSILAALCPPAGGAVVTAGLMIGTGAAAAGELILPGTPVISSDGVTNAVNNFLATTGLSAPAAGSGVKLTTTAWLIIAAIGGFILFLFSKRKRR